MESIQSTYNSVWSWHNNPICDINYGVLQGFPVLRKAVTTHVIKYCILLYVFGITNQLLSHYLPLAPFGQVDEWMAKPLPLFFGLWLLSTQICLLLSDSDVPTFQKGKKIKIQKVKQKVIFLVAKLVKAFLVAENESQQRKDLPQADFLSCTWRIYSVSKNLLNNSEFVDWKLGPLFVFVVI